MGKLFTLILAATMLTAVFASTAEAVPQWRLRRWSSRPPIDPTIRTTVSFNSGKSHRYYNNSYSRRGWRR